jgi:hypothetical protein
LTTRPTQTEARPGSRLDRLTVEQRLERGAQRLAARLAELEERLNAGDPVWREYAATMRTLAIVMPAIAPERRGHLMTTAQMASRFNISPRTLLRRAQTGKAQPAVRLGTRGRAALRWRGDEIVG